jgi:hypothetical protein
MTSLVARTIACAAIASGVSAMVCDDPELRHMGTDRVDHAGLLANEERACPVEHEAGAQAAEYLGVSVGSCGPRAQLGAMQHV